MTTRRSRGDGALFWDEPRQRWIATVTIGFDGRGKRIARKASGRTKTEAKDKLKALVKAALEGRPAPDARLTVKDAVNDWLEFGLSDRDPATKAKQKIIAETHVIPLLGARRLAELTTPEVDRWLMERSKNLGSDMLRRIHSCLNRSVKRAVARDLVARNVVSLATVPPGRGGRASKSLTTSQVDQILAQVPPGRMRAYIVLSLLTGARTEELRALSWEHVHLEAEKVGTELVPPHIEVWRSVRRGGDTKTRSSRRTLALPDLCVSVLRERWAEYADDRDRAADRWVENDLVFTTRIGTPLTANNVRRDFRLAIRGIKGINPADWTPRELRHSFVSVLSDAGVPLEEISRLVGHAGTTVTELVYRHQLRPVVQTGATVMNALFSSDGARSEPVRHPVRHPEASKSRPEAVDGGYYP